MVLGSFEVLESDILGKGKWDITEKGVSNDVLSMQKNEGLWAYSMPLSAIKEVSQVEVVKSGIMGKAIVFDVLLTNGKIFRAKAKEQIYQKIYEAQHIVAKRDTIVSKRLNIGDVRVVFIIIGAVLFFSFKSGEKHDNTQLNVTEESTQSVLKIKASELSRAYDENEASADSKYKNKILEVTGIVTSIDKDVTDQTVIILRGVDDFNGVHAAMKEDQEKISVQVRKGMKITVRCKSEGEIVGSAMLEKCSFVL